MEHRIGTRFTNILQISLSVKLRKHIQIYNFKDDKNF